MGPELPRVRENLWFRGILRILGPQAVGGGLAAEEKAGEQQGKSTHRESP